MDTFTRNIGIMCVVMMIVMGFAQNDAESRRKYKVGMVCELFSGELVKIKNKDTFGSWQITNHIGNTIDEVKEHELYNCRIF